MAASRRRRPAAGRFRRPRARPVAGSDPADRALPSHRQRAGDAEGVGCSAEAREAPERRRSSTSAKDVGVGTARPALRTSSCARAVCCATTPPRTSSTSPTATRVRPRAGPRRSPRRPNRRSPTPPRPSSADRDLRRRPRHLPVLVGGEPKFGLGHQGHFSDPRLSSIPRGQGEFENVVFLLRFAPGWLQDIVPSMTKLPAIAHPAPEMVIHRRRAAGRDKNGA